MVLIRSPAGAVCTFNGAHKCPVPDVATMAAYEAAGIKVINISQSAYDAIPFATAS
jgi:hypothetical protein